nr:XRE family transcriptional regulator [Nitrosomonas nitrosa]
MKPVHFVGSSREDLRNLPESVQETAGFQLFKVQQGKEPDDWKPMAAIGPGVQEIRVRDDTGTYRMFYVAKFQEALTENSKAGYRAGQNPICGAAHVEKGGWVMKRATVTKGSGNIFRDLGFSEERSAELILKSSLLQALQETIRDRGWKQVEAATHLGIDQAKVSKLLSGQMAGFSVERLVHFLSLLGQDVEVTVRQAPRGQRYGTVRSKVTRRSRTVARARSENVS